MTRGQSGAAGRQACRRRSAALAAALVLGCAGTARAQVVTESYGSETVFQETTSGVRDTTDAYTVGRLDCTASLRPDRVQEVAVPSPGFNAVLRAAYPPAGGWAYAQAAANLSNGSIIVRTYDVQGTATRAGTELHVRYTPGPADPSANIHWIQVVNDNHNITDNPGHGNPENVVDVTVGSTTPYYDQAMFAGDGRVFADSGTCAPTCNFYDFPGRIDAGNPHVWSAEAFVVQGPAPAATPGAITILTPGFRWGWRNVCLAREDGGGSYFGLLLDPTVLTTEGALRPGALLDFTATKTGSFTLAKGGVKATVRLTELRLRVEIDDRLDTQGGSSYVVTGGDGRFTAYAFGDLQVGASAFTVEQGTGFIVWQPGEMSATMRIRVQALGFADVLATVTGTAKIDAKAGTVILDSGAQAVGYGGSATSEAGGGRFDLALIAVVLSALALLAALVLFMGRRSPRG